MSKARDLANIISGSGTLNANVIPDLAASKITSGTLGADRIPDLAATKITSGTIASARLSLGDSDIPSLATSKITSGTFADARISASSVNAHVDLTSLSASNLTSGTVPSARLSLAESDVPTLTGNKISGGTFGAVNGSSLTSLPSSAPTNSQILSGVASASAGSVGSYICMATGGYSKGVNDTFSTNNAMFYCTMKGLNTGSQIQPSGTYRTMGQTEANSSLGANSTVFLRIS